MTSDFLAFLAVVFYAKSVTLKGHKMPFILRAIVKDATVYFFVIFTSHFLLETFLLFVNVSIYLLESTSTLLKVSPAKFAALAH